MGATAAATDEVLAPWATAYTGGGWLYRVTPLETAALAGDAEVALALLEAGADPKRGTVVFDTLGMATPLYTAVSNQNPDVARVLLENGASPDEVPGMQYGVPPEGVMRFGNGNAAGAKTVRRKRRKTKTKQKKERGEEL